ncbi:CD276 antigen-like isoform X2 [Seriola lalandi dorsalis]|uniref:CD276 antigen-like isoform X2 n=1 Tax=Seriola lalandi dorsalis TaxID=1841481 RepID=UPI000C6F9192|nr:CD276 antigen-like isoform X2 [Seriola lalandi dorsalis]
MYCSQRYVTSFPPWTVMQDRGCTEDDRVGWVLCSVVLSVLMLRTLGSEDSEVSCVVMESCILPCSFQGGTDVVIHWTQVTAGDLVHSFYHNQDQLAYQVQRFRDRTSLFKDQISRGNASLQLTGVKVQDQGRYKCHTSVIRGNKDSFINLKVDAPVDQVDLQQVENRITCSSEGIYPEPELTWSTSPPSNLNLQHKTTKQKTEQLLYNIRSYLIPSDSDLGYSCTVSTRRNRKRATLWRLSTISGSHSEATIPCTASNTSLTGFSLTWRFNHSQIILNQTRADVPSSVSEGWRQQVKGESESGSLMLQNLSPHHEGTYTCELSDAEETLTTNTFLRMENPGNITVRRGVGVTVVLAVVVAAVVVLVLYCIKKKGQQENTRESNIDEIQVEI